ncbi:patatin-like phospholipase family protein [Aquimarina sp. 2201CG5-10]|uniref:patatin-like phospholipase family protein n=1 Tax=Aquimarina callyspongiae TaxID=3098150 RepID=UPI002AB53261|nr:patatin-like phospholipase family protein [Aquimarina sp. 2201CG5-10]MDY8135221.1 patatin-like phospholipase family protein [Aquimarina sp. 2201CG5-10]
MIRYNSPKHFIAPIAFIMIFMLSKTAWSQEKETLQNQDNASSQDVKVGLVLSGGGAKGLAHIGALKIIEEAGVRIDYIGGTSMGAIVGALYASGYNAKQLDSIFRSIDFDKFIQDELPRNAKTFYEREDSEKYAITLPFDKFKIGLPTGFSKGQNFYNQFSIFTSHVNDIHDFSKLPIPFFCMATNIETGEQIVLDKGYLPEAVAASGALPSIFSPIELEGVLMTDGGVANNYPVEEIRKKGAEIVIGVDVQDSLMSKDKLNSVTNIMLQISNFRTINAMKTKVAKTNVYIKPSITDFSVISFDQSDKIIANGEKAAFANYEKLRAIKSRQRTTTSKSKIPKNVDSVRVNSLVILGNERYTRSYIKGKLKLKTPKTTTYQKLNEGINNLSGTGNFDRISHRILEKEEGKELELSVKESENKMFLRFALHYDDLYQTAALVNLTRKRFLFNNDVLSIDAALGDNIRYNLDYYIDKGFYWSIGMKYQYTNFEKAIDFDFIRQFGEVPDLDLNTVDVDYTDFNAQIYGETLLRETFSVGLGGEFKHLRIISETFGEDEDQIPRTVFEKSNYWSLFGYIKLDSYDNKYFPRSGFLFDGDIHGYLLSSDFNNDFSEFSIAKAKFGYATPLFDKMAMVLEFEAGTKIGNTDVRSLDFLLGGFGARTINNFVPFYGYDFLGITGQSFAKGLITFDYEIFKKHHINLSGNFANVGDKLFSTGKWFENPEFTGYALGYGLDTFIGPVQIKYSYSPELDESNWFFSIGFWF